MLNLFLSAKIIKKIDYLFIFLGRISVGQVVAGTFPTATGLFMPSPRPQSLGACGLSIAIPYALYLHTLRVTRCKVSESLDRGL